MGSEFEIRKHSGDGSWGRRRCGMSQSVTEMSQSVTECDGEKSGVIYNVGECRVCWSQGLGMKGVPWQ